ncbi:MAG: YraN family protein [Candidatus Limnocylindrales bacterium]
MAGPLSTDRVRTPAQHAGDAAEELVSSRLVEAGWSILARNVHVGRRELDLVAIDPGPPRTLVIVEVRWRARRDFGLAEQTVDHRKRSHVRGAGFELLERGGMPRLPLRFDLIVVEPGVRGGEAVIRHHRAAF